MKKKNTEEEITLVSKDSEDGLEALEEVDEDEAEKKETDDWTIDF